MTDGFVRQIESWAKSDAKKGIYMSAGFQQLEREHMSRYVSPDRAGLKAQVMTTIQAMLREKDPKQEFVEQMLAKLTGKSTAGIYVRRDCQMAEIRGPSGEVIASYNSSGSGWTDIQTREESRFFSGTAMAYLEAYRAARAELNAPAQAGTPAEAAPDGAALDVRA